LRDAEVSADGSHFRTGGKPDPRERQIDEEFMARDYRKDANGRFIRQPTPTSSIMMLPRQQSDESSQTRKKIAPMKPAEPVDIGSGPKAGPDPQPTLESPSLLGSLAGDVSQKKTPRNPMELTGIPIPG
jgi:hypothetical protein